MNSVAIEPSQIAAHVEKAVASVAISDIHTHLYDPAFGDLLLWGIDDLLVYHYLVAEAFRYLDVPYEKFWVLSKARQAELIWNELFIKHSPVSEACRGVLTTLHALGLDVSRRDLPGLRQWFKQWTPADHVTRCLDLAGVKSVCMTNSPFDDSERPVWERGFPRDERFIAALRIDRILVTWSEAVPILVRWGYKAESRPGRQTIKEVRRFLADWSTKIRARYLMVSLGPEFDFPETDSCAKLLENAVLPHCRETGLPLALMLGARRQVNPGLGLAGDGVGLSKLAAVERLCARFPENKFLVTVLARENQHELCVLARKFRNLHVFGCWWFMNVPVLVEEVTRLRLETIGLSVTPQHSDARVLDQLVYKWQHFRRIIGKVLVEKYTDLARTGWRITETEIRRDVEDLFGGEFERFSRTVR